MIWVVIGNLFLSGFINCNTNALQSLAQLHGKFILSLLTLSADTGKSVNLLLESSLQPFLCPFPNLTACDNASRFKEESLLN